MDSTNNELYKLLIPYIRKAVGVPTLRCIIGNQNASELSGEYCSMLIMSSQSVGMGVSTNTFVAATHAIPDDEETEEDESVPAVEEHFSRRTTALSDTKVSVEFYRGRAHEHARKLMMFPQTEAAYELLAPVNVVIKPIRDYRTLDYTSGGQWVARTQIDLYLQSSSEYADTVGVIDEGTIDVSVEHNGAITSNEWEIKDE